MKNIILLILLFLMLTSCNSKTEGEIIMPPEVLLEHVYWSFSEPVPQSPEQLIADVEKYYDEIEEKLDKTLLTETSPFTRLKVTYDYGVSKPKGDGTNDVKWEDVQETIIIDGNGKRLTYADILWQIHKAAYKNLEDDDHHYFEGLELIEDKDKDGLPLYDMFLGS